MDSLIQRDACISECGHYRWSLSRYWDSDPDKPWIGWIMLNPSTADAWKDDPTIRRCIGFTKSWGYVGLQVCNLFGFRATNPKDLLKTHDPVGDDNDKVILEMPLKCSHIFAAWGTGGILLGRDKQVIQLCREVGIMLLCLGHTKDGHPVHPLYQPLTAKPIAFRM